MRMSPTRNNQDQGRRAPGEPPACNSQVVKGSAVYTTRESQSVREQHAGGLGNFQTLVSTRDLLTEQLPIWETVLIGVGGLALLLWTADAVRRGAKRARKSLGV